MPSEYDFLSPLSRRLRRAGLAVIGVGAFLAGAVAMAAIVALPLFSIGGSNKTPATEANLGAAQEPTEAAPLAAKPATSATTHDAIAKTPPVSAKPDAAAARRETTGVAGVSAPASSGTNPPDTKSTAVPPSPRITSAATAAVPTATAQSPHSETNGGASAGEGSAAGTSGQAADGTSSPARAATGGGEASPRAKKKSTASRTRRAQSERAARWRQREEYRSTQAFGERRAGREYVDGNGVRYFVMPRSAQSAFAYDDAPRTRRLFITRPGGPFYDDD